ncbi:MAG: UDP-N-acetylglucosamine 1-carboxyvinyltransferase [Bacillota bacterium]|nr:UDP-N-acetylglucosamine 1-carboxyvinyltransferase [Bacillota bacterium]
MEQFVIHGGRRLSGTVTVSGSKNAVLPMMAAAVLSPEQCTLRGVPRLRDVAVMREILERLGVQVACHPDGTLEMWARELGTCEVRDELSRQMRSSIFLMGPLLARAGKVKVAYPGGCAIGPRPIDLHLRGLEALGARLRERHGYIYGEAPRLRGQEIHLDFPSVGATENIMMAAVLARGVTVIGNAAKEPEIVDLQNFLNAMGARITGAGTDVIHVEGVRELGGCQHQVIPDRIEAGTMMAAAAITGGEVLISGVIPEHLESVTAKLKEAGAAISCPQPGQILVRGPERILATDFKTLPYPGFPTDMQPQVMALMCLAEGTSVITETVFENRFKHADELRRMGAQIKVEGRAAVVKGVPVVFGALVEATDLRSGAALVLAGLAAEGVTTVEDTSHIDRGYEHLEAKLAGLGAHIERSRAGSGPPTGV